MRQSPSLGSAWVDSPKENHPNVVSEDVPEVRNTVPTPIQPVFEPKKKLNQTFSKVPVPLSKGTSVVGGGKRRGQGRRGGSSTRGKKSGNTGDGSTGRYALQQRISTVVPLTGLTGPAMETEVQRRRRTKAAQVFPSSRQRKRDSEGYAQREKPRKRARRYSDGYKAFLNQSPQLPPPAPAPAGGKFFGAELQNPLETPALNTNLTKSNVVDKLEAEGLRPDLDFYGTNAGLVYHGSSESLSSEQQRSADAGSGSIASHSLFSREKIAKMENAAMSGVMERPEIGTKIDSFSDAGTFQKQVILRLRERVANQDLYIARLEDENVRLKNILLEIRSKSYLSEKSEAETKSVDSGSKENDPSQ